MRMCINKQEFNILHFRPHFFLSPPVKTVPNKHKAESTCVFFLKKLIKFYLARIY